MSAAVRCPDSSQRSASTGPNGPARLLGRLWSEGSELALSRRRGRVRLEAFAYPEGPQWLLAHAGGGRPLANRRRPELGELLRVVRDGEGAVVKLYVATYPRTRAPAAFGESASS